jgi:prevent-host-death family protein
MKQKTIGAGEFKNSCLKLMDEVQKSGIPLIVTKRGKPVVQVSPAPGQGKPQDLLGTVVYEAPHIFSTGEEWEAES